MPAIRTYRKTMTRDNGLIIQEAWSYAFEEGFEKTTGLKNPYAPSLVYHVADGATEIWEQDMAFAWLKNALLERNKEGPALVDQCLKAYEKLIKAMQIFRKQRILGLPELKKLVRRMREASRLFVVLYYSAMDERTPRNVRDKALAWREKDVLYDAFEQVIKCSIADIAPWAKGRELVVTIDDMYHIPPTKILQQRFKESIFIPGKPVETISLGEFCSKNRGYRFIIEKPGKNAKEGILTGQAASPGIARGNVRILRRKSQANDLQPGEILVSPMTTPDLVPAMQKSSAIITDEGGITCHAAIVARELKKPCIIGTKFATSILQDGDFVEVDANAGIITILKSANREL